MEGEGRESGERGSNDRLREKTRSGKGRGTEGKEATAMRGG